MRKPASHNEHPLTLSVGEAAELLGLSRGLVYRAVAEGSLPSIKVGRRIIIPRTRLMEILGHLQPVATEVIEPPSVRAIKKIKR